MYQIKFLILFILFSTLLYADSNSVKKAEKRSVHVNRTLQIGIGGTYSFTDDSHFGGEIHLLRRAPFRSQRSKHGVYFGTLFCATFTPETEHYKVIPMYDIGLLVGGRYMQGGAGLLVKKVESKVEESSRETFYGFEIGSRFLLPMQNRFSFSVSPKFCWIDDEAFLSGTVAVVFQFSATRLQAFLRR